MGLFLVFTPVNIELRKISSDQVTAFVVIINELRGHWSLVTFHKHAYYGICEIWLELFGGYKNKKAKHLFSRKSVWHRFPKNIFLLRVGE